MNIRQIRFKNLNSLAGEWSIDLTHPAFAGDGIFAIRSDGRGQDHYRQSFDEVL
jgi:hypothetical protein